MRKLTLNADSSTRLPGKYNKLRQTANAYHQKTAEVREYVKPKTKNVLFTPDCWENYIDMGLQQKVITNLNFLNSNLYKTEAMKKRKYNIPSLLTRYKSKNKKERFENKPRCVYL